MNTINESIWKQFGASIDMLENAITYCPEEHWNSPSRFWYNADHCLFFLDYYLTMNPGNFLTAGAFYIIRVWRGDAWAGLYKKGTCRVFTILPGKM